MLEIRRLPAERWDDYRRLRLEALKSGPAAFASSVEEEETLSEGDWKRRIQNVFFAMSGDKPVGMIVCAVSGRLKTRHTADIFGAYVRGEYRGKGIGGALLRAALSEIRKNKEVVKVRLSVNPEQKAAVKLYKKAGFVVIGRAQKDLKIGRRYHDLLQMEKLL